MKIISVKRRTLIIAMAVGLFLSCFGTAIWGKSGSGLDKQSAEYCFQVNSPAMFYVRSYNERGKLLTTGSGFIVSKSGYAVTAAHVLKKGVSYTVELNDGTLLDAELISLNEETDVAVIKLPKGSYKVIEVTDTAPKSGSELRALGYPMKNTLVITEGICSAPNATISYKEKMLVTCQIASGMSGGPVLNEYGQAVGVVSGTVVTMTGIGTSALTQNLWEAVKSYIK